MLTRFKTIRSKLLLVVALLSGVALTCGIVGLSKLATINSRLEQIVNVASTKQLLAARSRQALLAMHRAEKNLILSQTQEEMDRHAQSIDQQAATLDENLNKLFELANDENKRLIGEFRTSFDAFTAVNKQVREASRRNTNEKAYELSFNEGREIVDEMETVLRAKSRRNDATVSRLLDEAQAATADSQIKAKLADADDAATRALLSSQLLADMIALQRTEKNFILERDGAKMREFAAAMDRMKEEVGGRVEQVLALATDENKAALARFDQLQEQWLANNAKVQELSLENSNQVAFELSSSEGRDRLNSAETALKAVADMADEAMLADAEASGRDYAQARLLVIGTLVVGVSVGVCFAYVIITGILRGIGAMVARLRDIAEGEGDLTQRVDESRPDELGEMGRWFNVFVRKIHDVVAEVSSSATEVAGAATQIAASSEEMAVGIREQSSQVTQISSAIEEMSSSIVEVARKSGDAAGSAGESGRMAEEGGRVVRQTVEGMGTIREAVDTTATSVRELGERGAQIGQIIEVINDIADQTNLLALNAAIEAARAGEHGRGFAVVADEVRKLADRTTRATEEIGESIQAIQRETAQAVERMDAGTGEVARGVELATSAGESLSKIVASAQTVAAMVESIAAAAEQQSAASEEVSRSVESISSVVTQSSEGASQAAAAATQLSSKAEQLQRLVGQFKIEHRA